jgi:hypothetical protein
MYSPAVRREREEGEFTLSIEAMRAALAAPVLQDE